MDRGGPDGQNGLFSITASMWSMWSIENSFFAHLTTEAIPVFFNPVFQLFRFSACFCRKPLMLPKKPERFLFVKLRLFLRTIL